MTLLQAALVRLGPGGDYVREFASTEAQPTKLIKRSGWNVPVTSTGVNAASAHPPINSAARLAHLVGMLTAFERRLAGQRLALGTALVTAFGEAFSAMLG